MRQVGSVLWPKLRALQIYGANTGVGKTVVSTLLTKALRRRFPKYAINYLKPISTGPLKEADNGHISKYTSGIASRTLVQFSDPVSPHLAARGSGEPIDDHSLLRRIQDELINYVTGYDAYAVVETAGGVLSPAPSGSTQADFYRPLRLPVVLVGDHRLGGIGSTISAWESLHVRGYDVPSILLFEDSIYGNSDYLKDYFKERNVPTLSLPPPPTVNANPEQDEADMKAYYDQAHQHESFDACIDGFEKYHAQRLEKLQSLSKRANDVIWHPFMQHTERSEKTILAIDSAYGEYFQAHTPNASPTTDREDSLVKPAFDGSASWWTQGLGHGNPSLALTAAHTAGRYGHVMFANAAHEPAVTLAETLLKNLKNPRLSRVFYSDNGSTGMEVALKMALKASSKRYGWKTGTHVEILGLTGSYHGDTMGTMDCSEPNVYNEKVEWYQGKGHWFDFPTVKMREGKWIVERPESIQDIGESTMFDSLNQVLDFNTRSAEAKKYRKYLDKAVRKLQADGRKFGALIMEPIILGAGGMNFADPLFQKTLVDVVRALDPSKTTSDVEWSGMPVIFDEVFTGLYRLGEITPSDFLQTKPDISVHAKLLTGGLLPLATTEASESIFKAFLSTEKSDALLHGHSYTAHAVGCQIANESLRTMMTMEKQGAWEAFQSDWKSNAVSKSSTRTVSPWSMWSKDFVTKLSFRPDVDSVLALGSVLAISLKDPSGAGYTSTAAIGLRDKLLAGPEGAAQVVHSRVLGNILYLMASITSTKQTLVQVEGMVEKALG